MRNFVREFWRSICPRGPIQWAMAISIGLSFGLIGIAYHHGQYPVDSNEVTVLTPQVRAGEDFILRYDVIWNDTCTVTGYRFIIDGSGYVHERIVDERTVLAGADHFDIRISVPSSASEGRGSYRGSVEYVCNPLQSLFPLRREITPREFQILPPVSESSAVMPYNPPLQCSVEKPVYVQSYCRSLPNQHAMDQGIEVDLNWN